MTQVRAQTSQTFSVNEQITRTTMAARIAEEWSYTAAQVLLVVNAADGNETIAREALRLTAQMGGFDPLNDAARAARQLARAARQLLPQLQISRS